MQRIHLIKQIWPEVPTEMGNHYPLSLIESKRDYRYFCPYRFYHAEGPEIGMIGMFSELNFRPNIRPAICRIHSLSNSNLMLILRTHTSSVQSRVMAHQKPPIRMLFLGRVYRNEAISYRAHCFFHQVEGLYWQECFVCRPQASFWCILLGKCLAKKPDSFASILFPLHWTKRRNGHFVQYMWR